MFSQMPLAPEAKRRVMGTALGLSGERDAQEVGDNGLQFGV
jgi:hypothetical protein